jgi:hypothetical protein
MILLEGIVMGMEVWDYIQREMEKQKQKFRL